MRRLAIAWAFALSGTLAIAADSTPASMDPTLPTADVVRMLFRSAGSFRVAQAATVPISLTHGASFLSFDPLTNPEFALAPNTFASVFASADGGGGRLLPDAPVNDWGDDFVNGMGPTSLNGVRVLVNGKEAFLSFVGRAEQIGANFDQINFLAPDDEALGLVSVEVFNGQDRVGASMVNLGPLSPGLIAFPARDQVQYVVATSAGGQFLLPAGFFEGLDTRPAASGEVIIMFGTGFGATLPPMPVGQIPSELSVIPAGVRVVIGGLDAIVEFAGLAPCCAGLYQFNVRVPQLANGDRAVTVERDGVSSQSGLSLLIENQ